MTTNPEKLNLAILLWSVWGIFVITGCLVLAKMIKNVRSDGETIRKLEAIRADLMQNYEKNRFSGKVLFEVPDVEPDCDISLDLDSAICQTPRFRSLLELHFREDGNGMWPRSSPVKLQAFLRDLTDTPDLTLVKVIEKEQPGMGYGKWNFWYVTGQGEKSVPVRNMNSLCRAG